MTDITIPKEAALYARDAIKAAKECRSCAMYDDKMVIKSCRCFYEAHAACLAMLENWPGVRLGKYRDVAGPNDRIILPLTENANAEA